jgi:ArsR family transcriptional regulator
MGENELVESPVKAPTSLIVNGREMSDRSLRSLTEVFRSLADRSRLMILFLLAERGEMNVSAIGEALNQSQPAVSHHLTQLRGAGFIDFRRDGKFNYYRIDPNGFAELMSTLFPDGSSPRITFGALEVMFRVA